MIGPSTSWSRDAGVLLAAIFALNVYRAATQSITTDEAFTYLQFVSQRWAGLLAPYDANNHVLYSLLARLSVSVFGLSEFTLRLPSVLAGGVYLLAARSVCRRVFGEGGWSFLVTALLCTNPFLLDHLSAARGYGLALAFLMLAADHLLRDRLEAAGVFCGLAVAANLTSLFPVAALALAFLWSRRRAAGFWERFIVPCTLVAFVLVIIPLSKAAPGNFYFGAGRFSETLHSLADLSLPQTLRAAVWPAVLLLLAASAVFVVWRRESFFPAALMASVALVAAAHRAFGMPYPLTRTALHFVPLAILSASSMLFAFRGARLVKWCGAAVGMVCLGGFLLQIHTQYYAEWRFDAGTGRIANLIHARSAGRHVVVRTSWPMEPSLNFYRVLHRWDWEPLDRGPLDRAGDFWVLLPEDRGQVQSLHLREIYRDAVSDVTCAVKQ